MNWSTTYNRLKQMIGVPLRSISGNTDIKITEVTSETIGVSGRANTLTRRTDELKRIVERMELGIPVHVDSVLFGSGTSRNQPETILANMPDVEWLSLNNRKHIVWVGHSTHEIGTIREMSEIEATQLRVRYRGKGAVTGSRPTTLIVRTGHSKFASDLISAALQQAPEALPGMPVFRISGKTSEVALVSDTNCGDSVEFIPVLKVADADEAVARLRAVSPALSTESFELDKKFIIVRIPGTGPFALE